MQVDLFNGRKTVVVVIIIIIIIIIWICLYKCCENER